MRRLMYCKMLRTGFLTIVMILAVSILAPRTADAAVLCAYEGYVTKFVSVGTGGTGQFSFRVSAIAQYQHTASLTNTGTTGIDTSRTIHEAYMSQSKLLLYVITPAVACPDLGADNASHDFSTGTLAVYTTP